MKIPKQFIYFLIIAQAILTAGHFLLYQSLVFFFPFFANYSTAALVALMVLSFSFLITSILDFKSENEILRWAYLGAAVWVPVWFYLLLAAALSSIIYLLDPQSATPIIVTPVFAMAVVVAVYGIVNARLLRIVRITVRLPNLPQYWKGKTAVMASDIHLGHVLREGFSAKVVKKINSLKPDIVFIPGDFFDGVHTNFSGLAAPFKNLRSTHGAYFCSGNHEAYAGLSECEQALRGANIIDLDDKKIEIEGLQIAGLPYGNGDKISGLAEKLLSLNLDRNRPSVLLKHVPLQIPEIAASNISLQLSGHSHQGQLWPGSLITKKVWKGFDYGLKKVGAMLVYISSGVGTWGPPVRTFTRSEIVQITFE